jgi:hypothetical protein
MGNPLLSREMTRLLDKRLTKAYFDEYTPIPQIKDKIFTSVSEEKAWLEYFGVNGMPDPDVFNGTVQYQSVSPGYWTKIEAIELAGGFMVERKMLDDDQYGIAKQYAGKLGGAMARKQNKIAHEPFRYADSASFTFMQSEEGVALCSNSHTTKAPNVSTSTGFDNYATLALDPVNLEALRIQGLQLRDPIGERYESNFDTIIYPSSLAETVYEITKTPSGLNTEYGNVNMQAGRWKTIELPMLDDWDTSNWFIVDSKAMKEALIWFDRIKTEFNSTTDFDTMIRKYMDYSRIGWGFTGWRWIIGSFPA